MIQCPLCAKTFKSRSGFRRHSNREHPVDQMKAQPHEEPVTENQDAEDQDVLLQELDSPEMLKRALKALGIRREDVYQFKVYPTKVVIIEEPKRWKKTWYTEEQ